MMITVGKGVFKYIGYMNWIVSQTLLYHIGTCVKNNWSTTRVISIVSLKDYRHRYDVGINVGIILCTILL